MNDNNGAQEPIILGQLRKQKSSKPAFVTIVFLVTIGVCLGLPYIQDYLKEAPIISTVYNYLFGTEEAEEKIIITKDTIHRFSEKTVIPYNTIILSNILMKDETMTYDIKTKNDEAINLDESNLFLEVYGSSNNLLRKVKLTGVISSELATKTFTFIDLKFNPSSQYYGRIQAIELENYDEFTFPDKMGELTCTNRNHEYNYIFENNNLRISKHKYTLLASSDINGYMNKLTFYNALADKIKVLPNCTASLVETDAGLEFNARLDMAKMSISDLGDYIDYNYYALDTLAKVVKFEMRTKGFDCK